MSAQCAALHAFAKPRRSCLKTLGLELAGGDVVEKEQRARAKHGNIVDAVVDEILTDGVVTSDGKGHFQFRAHAVHAGHEHRRPSFL